MEINDVKQIGVLGGGLMGSGIVQNIILSGYKTVCRDLTDEILENTRGIIISSRFGMLSGIKGGKFTKGQMDEALGRLTLTTKVEDLENCDIIIESVGGGDERQLEDKELKKRVFAEIDNIVKKEAIFATNTSFFTIADLAEAVQRKDRFIGMHWFRPPNILKAIELVYTQYNSEEIIRVMEEFCQRLGKTSARVKDVPGDTGFIGNRIWTQVTREARRIVEEGVATPRDVDAVMKLGYGFTLGPFEMGAETRDPRQRSGGSS